MWKGRRQLAIGNVPLGFYLVHASSSLCFSEWCAGSMWIADRFGTAIICPSFDLCRVWCGQIVCGVRVVSALTASADPWYLGDVAWELENPVPCARGVSVKGTLGVWKVSDDVRKKFDEARVEMRRTEGGLANLSVRLFQHVPYVPSFSV